MWKYVKSAFTYHWNLLALVGAGGLAVLSGHPDVWLPVVAAAEVGYLTLLGTHPRFQAAVNASEAERIRESLNEDAGRAYRRIVASLPREYVERFEELRDRCEELQDIGRGVRPETTDDTLENVQLEGLDSLLWLYLKLLHTHHSLARFLRTTSEDRIRAEMERIDERIARLEKADESDVRTSMLNTLHDDRATSQRRLDNLLEARNKGQLVELELARVENKIRALGEIAVNRRHTGELSRQVDEAADGMKNTERLIHDLQSFSGLDREIAPPPLLRRRTVTTQH
jgi:chemotaxis protein histidine kinase CheA